MRARFIAVGWVVAVTLGAGCGGNDGAGLFTPDDAGGVDAGGDDGALDSTVDAGEDATVDAGRDASPDGGADAPVDAPLDAPADARDASVGCDPVGAPYHFHVNPVSGTDAPGGTGSGTQNGAPSSACALKTITHALSLLPPSAPAGTQIIVDVTSTIAAGESFPIAIPANVVILGAVGANVTVAVPAGTNGFGISTAGAGLANLVLDGSSQAAQNGIVSAGGALGTITGVEVMNFAAAGIRMESGKLTIDGGTYVHQNGASGSKVPGLRVLGDATATILGGTIAAPTRFSQNAGAGIDVSELATVQMTGTLAANMLGIGTVVVDKNGAQGITIAQALVKLPPFPPASSITGVVAADNGTMGVEVLGGSALTLRGSVMLKNGMHGVNVAGNPAGAVGDDFDDIARIDLGTAGIINPSYGKNVVQDDNAFNQGVGICLALRNAPASVGQKLKAAGNIFSATIDCSQMSAVLKSNKCNAGSNGPLGITGTLDSFDVTMCSYN